MSDTPATKGTRSRRRKPLAGRTVMVTRAREQAAGLTGPLEALGAQVIAFPVIDIVDPDDWAPVDEAISRLSRYDWVVLTSTNAAERFLARIRKLRLEPADALGAGGPRVAAVGSATAARLSAAGVEVALVPDDFRAEGLVEVFRAASGQGSTPSVSADWRVLIPRAAEAREVLPDTLRDMGHEVDVVSVYRTVPARPDRRGLDRLKAGSIDAITFTSGSTVRYFLAALEAAGLDPAHLMAGLVLASVGPVTSSALAKRGFKADVEAAESTMSALARALADYYAGS